MAEKQTNKPKRPTKRKVPQERQSLMQKFNELSDDEVLTMRDALEEYVGSNFEWAEVSDDDLHTEETDDGGTDKSTSGFTKFFGG